MPGDRDPPIFRELEGRFDWERKAGPREPYKLDRMRAFARRAGDPQAALKGIYHVAGSKGKGSTALFLAQGLEALGHRVGLYTSPHLRLWSERITRAGAFWPEVAYEAALGRALELATEGETVFEILTLAAWLLFAEQGCDRVVLEVGLGGRLDATNLVTPYRSVLTHLELEHTDVLGDTLSQIAFEKAGILKPGRPAWTYRQDPEAERVLRSVAAERGAPLLILEEHYDLSLQETPEGVVVGLDHERVHFSWSQRTLGRGIARNAALAFAVLVEGERLSVASARDLTSVLAKTRLAARLEWFSGRPDVLLDGAHTVSSVRQLVEAVRKHWGHAVTVFGANADKDVAAMAGLVAEISEAVYLTQSAHPRSLPASELQAYFGGRAQVIEDPVEAFQRARQACPPGGVVVVTGSLYLAAEVRPLLSS